MRAGFRPKLQENKNELRPIEVVKAADQAETSRLEAQKNAAEEEETRS